MRRWSLGRSFLACATGQRTLQRDVPLVAEASRDPGTAKLGFRVLIQAPRGRTLWRQRWQCRRNRWHELRRSDASQSIHCGCWVLGRAQLRQQGRCNERTHKKHSERANRAPALALPCTQLLLLLLLLLLLSAGGARGCWCDHLCAYCLLFRRGALPTAPRHVRDATARAARSVGARVSRGAKRAD